MAWHVFAHALGVPGDRLVRSEEPTKARAIETAIRYMADPYYQRKEGRVGIHRGLRSPLSVWTYSAGKWTPKTELRE